MFTNDFEKYFEGHLSAHFKGVFAFDQIPTTLKPSNFIICNTSNANDLGEHWFVIYRNGNTVECFDSLGINSEKLLRFNTKITFRGAKKLKYNITQVQSSSTSTCGLFCVFFIYQRFYNTDLNFTELLNEIYSVDVNENEMNVKTFLNNLF